MPERTSQQRSFPTAEQITDLTEAVLTLTDQVRHLRHSVDEIEAELGWTIRTKVLDRFPPPQFPCDTRLSLNSPPDELGGFEHAYDPEDCPVDESPAPADGSTAASPAVPRRQSNLW